MLFTKTQEIRRLGCVNRARQGDSRNLVHVFSCISVDKRAIGRPMTSEVKCNLIIPMRCKVGPKETSRSSVNGPLACFFRLLVGIHHITVNVFSTYLWFFTFGLRFYIFGLRYVDQALTSRWRHKVKHSFTHQGQFPISMFVALVLPTPILSTLGFIAKRMEAACLAEKVVVERLCPVGFWFRELLTSSSPSSTTLQHSRILSF